MTARIQVLFVSAVVAMLVSSGCEKTPPSELKAYAVQCMRDNDLECAERRWSEYLDVQPNDSSAVATLGIVQSEEGEDADAISNLQKAVSQGQGTYDIFAAYARSLGRVGKTDEAIDWSYKALTLVPSLVDVRGDLATLLVKKKRYYEALALLAAFDEHMVRAGQQPYFDGQRISIESTMQQSDPGAADEKAQVRLFRMDGNFMAPVAIGQSRVYAFVVDTGASYTTLSELLLTQSKATYEVIRPAVTVRTADGRAVYGRMINIDRLRVGTFLLKDVSAFTCFSCESLLGQDSLSRFDLSSSKVQGVEFLTLKPREPAKSAAVE